MFVENEISEKAFGGTELTKRGLAKLIDPELLSNFQITCSRVRSLDEDKIRVYWVHDLPNDPECEKLKDENFRNQFHQIVFTSEYQYVMFRNILDLQFDERYRVIESCIEPIDFVAKPDDKINLIYHTTPHRGLALLIPAFDYLSKLHPEIHLHVFSSFKMYGWPDADDTFEPLFKQCREHPMITYHEFSGATSNDEVREQLQQTHIFAYPCIWQETFCRSLVEAMSASVVCVHPNYGALPFTSGGLSIMYPGDINNQKHVNIFARYTDIAINMIKSKNAALDQRLVFNKAYVDTLYSQGYIASKWSALMGQLLKAFPTVESRKMPGQILTFKTS